MVYNNFITVYNIFMFAHLFIKRGFYFLDVSLFIVLYHLIVLYY